MSDPTQSKPSKANSAKSPYVRAGCSRSLLARKAIKHLRMAELGEGVEALFPNNCE